MEVALISCFSKAIETSTYCDVYLQAGIDFRQRYDNLSLGAGGNLGERHSKCPLSIN